MKKLFPLIQKNIAADVSCVLVTIVEIIGSSPRELGTTMLVTDESVEESIGGGALEYRSIVKARELLSNTPHKVWHEEFFGLGPALNQCCGGAVKLVFEVLSKDENSWISAAVSALNNESDSFLVTDLSRQKRYVLDSNSESQETPISYKSLRKTESNTFRIVRADDCYLVQRLIDERSDLLLFGAGHVGKAVVQSLSLLPFRLHWIDQRSDIFPESIPGSVQVHSIDDSLWCIQRLSAESFCLVMTHSHQLDYEICKAVLEKPEDVWLGLIGSVTKRRRFEQRLLCEGIAQHRLDKLICPIGLSGITDKSPSTIAASVAAQLLQERELRLTRKNTQTTAASA